MKLRVHRRPATRRLLAVLLRWAPRAIHVVIALVAVIVIARALVHHTPVTLWIEPARFARPPDAFEVTDRHGEVLRHARVDGIDRRWVELRDVSPALVDAVIATEDARFREHEGIDAVATLRAAATVLRPWGRRSGASTITQQLVKLVYGRPHGIWSKPVEIARADALERVMTKDQILEQYLNRLPFGDRIQGVARASEEYFGHSVAELTVAEAALLAGIPQAPSATEPRRHLPRARRRAAYVLTRMLSVGRIDAETRAASAAELPRIRAIAARPNEAPRFVDAVIAGWKVGQIDRDHAGVRTTLDLPLQREVDATLADAVDRFASRGVTNAAAIVVDNATGEILAYTGAARRAGPGGSLDLLERRRQPGSSLKPFVYEVFFERGGTAATVLDDISLPRTGANGADYEAKDYDGLERGPVRARVALSASLNLAALDVAARVGQERLIARLRALGFRGVGAADHYGGAAVLGGLDVAPIDLARAYVTLARGGSRVPLTLVPAPGAATAGERVMEADAAEVVVDILSDSRARREAFGQTLEELAGPKAARARIALKTGTSSGWRDAWAAVFDETFTVVVWLGDPAGKPLGGVAGFEAAAPTAMRMLGAARSRATRSGMGGAASSTSTSSGGASGGAAPGGASSSRLASSLLVSLAICEGSGLRAGASCSHVVQERFAPGSMPTARCDQHDEAGDIVLPRRYASWVARTHPSGFARTFLESGATTDVPVVREPRDGARFLIDPARGATLVPLRARVGVTDVDDVQWEIDGKRLAAATWEMRPGRHEVVATWKGRRSEGATVHVEAAGRR